jgi:hypothetical protein
MLTADSLAICSFLNDGKFENIISGFWVQVAVIAQWTNCANCITPLDAITTSGMNQLRPFIREICSLLINIVVIKSDCKPNKSAYNQLSWTT